MNRRKRTQRRGFTLLELMLVLGILVVLAAFVVPAVTGTGEAAKKQAAKSMVGSSGSLAMAVQLYRQQLGEFPEKLIDLVERPDHVDEDDERWYKFLEEPNFVDPWGEELVYRQEGEINKNGYDLFSKGPDKEEDNEDDIGNFKKEK